MNKVNLFEAVKENVNLQRAAEYYGLEVHNGMACCIFHDDKTPSMKLYDDHFYCFGCGEHGDVTNLVAKQLNLSPIEAAKQIAYDFGISYDNQKGDYMPSKDSILGKIKREQDKAKENHIHSVLCDYFHLLRDWRTEYAPKSSEEALNPLFIKALTEMDYIENLLECFISGDKEEKADILRDENGSIAKIENTVRKFGSKLYANEMTM